MKRVTTTALGLAALVVMLVLGVFSAGSASAYLFLWTGPLPALILILNDNNQIFKPGNSEFIVTCRHFGGHGIASNGTRMNATEVTITGVYSKCEATGGFPVTITPVEYLIDASGLIGIVGKPIVLTVGGAGKCSLKVSSGGANASLFLLLYLNQPGGDILVHAEVGGIHSTGSGGACGEGENTEGTYFGLLLVSIHGGTIKWDLGP